MSAILEIADYLSEDSQAAEYQVEQGEIDVLSEVSIEHGLAYAINYIVRLKRHKEELRKRLAEVEREMALKTVLLGNTIVREQELRAQFVGRSNRK
jgi:hypothetical protein